ncbi:glucose-6-phosphate dehydrogenase [Desulfobacterota bacterium M19]
MECGTQTANAEFSVSCDRRKSARPPEPCAIVIFGASGDLTARKLIPAFFDLFKIGRLPEDFIIVGASRSPLNDDTFRARLMEKHQDEAGDDDKWQSFLERCFYVPLDYDKTADYLTLRERLSALDKTYNTAGNLVFYLAVPPGIYPLAAKHLGEAGMSRESEGGGWVRIVVEKPFGRDLISARELNHTMHESFAEEQIFRIDHYLAKETVQNVLMLRFANTLFEPLWNRNYIEYVGILASEKLGVEHRAGYYEDSGVIRDMFQNHMMQLLALTAMEAPSVFEAPRVHEEKVKVFRSIKPFTEARPAENLILGQYGAGKIDNAAAAAYRQEPGVDPGSNTPTFAMLRLFIDNWRWRGVPFYIASGKRLAEKKTKIVVQFKAIPHYMFRYLLGDKIPANRLILGIYPREEIKLSFQAKLPGTQLCMQTVKMDFQYQKRAHSLDAYSRSLLDCINGDHMLFWGQDGVEETWKYLDPILSSCRQYGGEGRRLNFYEPGSWGPDESLAWMRRILNV